MNLKDVRAGFNTSTLNNNFQLIEEEMKSNVLHTDVGNNQMEQDIDMNSNRVLNLPIPINSTEPLRLADLERLENKDVSGVVPTAAHYDGDGVTKIFQTGSSAPVGAKAIQVYIDKKRQFPNRDYEVVGTEVHFNTAPSITETVDIYTYAPVTIEGPIGPMGPRGPEGIGAQGPQGQVGPQGVQGIAGPQGVMGPTPLHQFRGTEVRFATRVDPANGNVIEWGNWTDIEGPQGVMGPQGVHGTSPSYTWDNTRIRFINPDGSWGAYQDLQGPQGVQGLKGEQGIQGLKGDSLTVDLIGTYADLSTHNAESFGFVYFAKDYVFQTSADETTLHGDGVTSVFTLPFEAGAATNLFVWVGNSYQTTDEYTIQGANKIAFTSGAPFNGANIVVRKKSPYTTTGALFVKLSDANADWSQPYPFGQGPQGGEGPRGPIGPQGPQGIRGPQGPEGIKGQIGITGPQGPQGIRGPQGEKGVQGDRGVKGQQGPQGVRGPVGPEGPLGPRGAQGPQGDKGVRGIRGPQGLQGPVGAKGPTGNRGERGSREWFIETSGISWSQPLMDAINPKPVIYDVGIEYNKSKGYSEARVYRGAGKWDVTQLVQNHIVKTMNGVAANKLEIGSASELGNYPYKGRALTVGRDHIGRMDRTFQVPANTNNLQITGLCPFSLAVTGYSGRFKGKFKTRFILYINGKANYTSNWQYTSEDNSTSKDTSMPTSWSIPVWGSGGTGSKSIKLALEASWEGNDGLFRSGTVSDFTVNWVALKA